MSLPYAPPVNHNPTTLGELASAPVQVPIPAFGDWSTSPPEQRGPAISLPSPNSQELAPISQLAEEPVRRHSWRGRILGATILFFLFAIVMTSVCVYFLTPLGGQLESIIRKLDASSDLPKAAKQTAGSSNPPTAAKQATQANMPKAAKQMTPSYKLTVEDLQTEWHANAFEANHKYKGKVIELTSFITAIVIAPNGEGAIVALEWGIQCSFNDGKETLGLVVEQSLTVTGIFDGKEVGPFWHFNIRDCHVTNIGRLKVVTLKGHTGTVNCVSFSPDGKMLVSGSKDKTIKLWDVATGKELATLKGHTSSVNCVVFSPDGKTVASGSDQTIKLWDVATSKELAKLWNAPTEKERANVKTLDYAASLFAPYFVVFSPDGKTLFAGCQLDGLTKQWDIATGKESILGYAQKMMNPHTAISPDGKLMASGSIIDGAISLSAVPAAKK
jgi:hypothetical protein